VPSHASERRSAAASTCALTLAIEAPRCCASSTRTATSLTSSIAAKKPRQAALARQKARRWVVEVCHSWFNRFRKLLVRYEKLERSFLALNHLAAAIIAFRKVPLVVNTICG
jgi:transposase